MAKALPPSASIIADGLMDGVGLVETGDAGALGWRKGETVARPIPLAAPVTTVALPFNRSHGALPR